MPKCKICEKDRDLFTVKLWGKVCAECLTKIQENIEKRKK